MTTINKSAFISAIANGFQFISYYHPKDFIQALSQAYHTEKSEAAMVKASKLFTLGWGILAIGIACIANLAENLIQLVNIIGSIFYGNVLGIFLLAFFIKFVKGNAVFTAALITQVIVIALFLLNEYEFINLPFLWLNFVGCAIVMIIATIIQSVSVNPSK